MVNILKLQRRTARYELADGIRDFQFAFWLLVTGFYAWVVWDLPEVWLPLVRDMDASDPAIPYLAMFVLPIGIPLLISEFGLRWANEFVRRRWLWRNTGFIKSKSWVVPRIVLFVSFVIMFGVWIAGILVAIQTEDLWLIIGSMYMGVGLSYTYLYFAMGNHYQIRRYRWIAIAGGIGTVLLAFIPMTVGLFCFVLSIYWAVVLMMSGGYAVRQVANAQKALDDAA